MEYYHSLRTAAATGRTPLCSKSLRALTNPLFTGGISLPRCRASPYFYYPMAFHVRHSFVTCEVGTALATQYMLSEGIDTVWSCAAFGQLEDLRGIVEGHKEKREQVVDKLDDRGCSALIWSTRNGHERVVRYLLNEGAHVEVAGYGGMRPLHHAANTMRECILTVLLEHGADVNAKDDTGATALHYASARGVVSIVIKLLENGANANAQNGAGTTPLHKAATFGQTAAIKKLLEYSANTNATDSNGDTALHLASKCGFGSVVSQLMRAGCRADLANHASLTAAQLAVSEQVAELFKQ